MIACSVEQGMAVRFLKEDFNVQCLRIVEIWAFKGRGIQKVNLVRTECGREGDGVTVCI